ncbi:MAG: hypothetical protein Fur009_7380 [Candidatus Microgenomates bacterium]
MEKIVDFLRKLGVFRSGFTADTYTSGKNRPTEFMMDNVYDQKKDLINKKSKNIFFWIFLIIIFLIFLPLIFVSNSNKSKNNQKNQSIKLAAFVSAKEIYSELVKTAKQDWSDDAILIMIESSKDIERTKLEQGKSNLWMSIFYSPSKNMTRIYNFTSNEKYGGVISKGIDEKVNKKIPYLLISNFIDSQTIYDKAINSGINNIRSMILVSADVPHYNFFENGKKPLKTLWYVINDSGTKIFIYDAISGEKLN